MSDPDYDDLLFEGLNYNSYLKIPELLGLQNRISEPPHHDEMFFIIIHQAAELWFKEVLHETVALSKALGGGNIYLALKVLKRLTAIMDLQVRQINLLSTLTPHEFAGFRDKLRPASGFQSAQFREIEFTYGLRDPFFLKFFQKRPDLITRLETIQREPSVYDVFIQSLQRIGFQPPVDLTKRDFTQPHTPHVALTAFIKTIYEQSEKLSDWMLLLEAMVDFDEKFSHWRAIHILVVTRAIGSKPGTGGSAGVKFLRSRADLKCFPDLWEARNHIGGDY